MKKLLLFVGLGCSSVVLVAGDGPTLLCATPEKVVIEDKTQKSIYVNCKREGMTYWFSDTMKIKSQVNFKEGQENGLYTSFYDNGNKRLEVNYVMGHKDGIQKNYYDNGKIGSEVKYVLGKREGVMTDWDIEGFKSAEVFYKNNYKVGIKKYYDKDGNVTMTEEYKMDRNPLMLKLLKDKRKEILIDLSKYGLISKDAKKEEKMR